MKIHKRIAKNMNMTPYINKHCANNEKIKISAASALLSEREKRMKPLTL